LINCSTRISWLRITAIRQRGLAGIPALSGANQRLTQPIGLPLYRAALFWA
jgi:hypothetical protein